MMIESLVVSNPQVGIRLLTISRPISSGIARALLGLRAGFPERGGGMPRRFGPCGWGAPPALTKRKNVTLIGRFG